MGCCGPEAKIANILRPGAHGDVVMTSAVTCQWKRQGYCVHYYTDSIELAGLLRGVADVHPVSEWDERKKGLDHVAAFVPFHRTGIHALETICGQAGLPLHAMELKTFPRPRAAAYVTVQRKCGWSSLKEYPHWAAVLAQIGLPVVELAEGMPWAETCALIQHASLHLGGDSVCAHIAGAYQTPAVVVFGSTSPEIFGHPTATNLSVAPMECGPCNIEDRFANGHRFGEACPVGGCAQFVPVSEVVAAARVRMRATNRLSVVMIVKNEESCLMQCLASVRGADEIVVMDTGSTDGTLALLENARAEYPNLRIFRGDWPDDFSAARNAAAAHASGDWILSIDADETLQAGGMECLRFAIQCTPGRTLKLTLVSKNNPSAKHRVIRCFRRGVKWIGACHEVPDCNDGGECAAVIAFGYSPAHTADPDRCLRILTNSFRCDPKCARTLYYLAREWWYRKDYGTALWMFTICIKLSTFDGEKADAWLYCARIHQMEKRPGAAVQACLSAIAVNPDFAEALRFMAELSPKAHSARWASFAAQAQNERVLFLRG